MIDWLRDNGVAIMSHSATVLVTLVVACVVAKLSHRHALKQIQTRIYSERRCVAVAEIFASMMQAYLKLLGMLGSRSDPAAKDRCRVASEAWGEFDHCYFRNCLFLSREFDKRFLWMSNKLAESHRTLEEDLDAQDRDHGQADDNRKYYAKEAQKVRNYIVKGGELDKIIQELRDDLQDFLGIK